MDTLIKNLYIKYNQELNTFSCKDDLKKQSTKSIKLLNHQLRVRDYFQKTDIKGLLLYHGLGSGKTITSIISAYSKGMKSKDSIVVLTPASLKDNYTTEIKKLKVNPKHFEIISYNTSKITKQLTSVENKIVVVDECHNLFSMISNNSKIGEYVYSLFQNAKNTRFLFLSGTPIINSPYELALLFNILRPKIFFGKSSFTKEEFENYYILHEYNHKVFSNLIKGLVSFYPGVKNPDIFPKLVKKQIVLNMTPLQIRFYNYYKKLENKALIDINRQQEMYKVYTRQVCNFAQIENLEKINDSDLRFQLKNYSPKYAKMLNIIKYSQGPVLIYSNFKEVGVNLISRILDLNGISNVMWTGEESSEQREKNLQAFNSKENKHGEKIKCFLITSAGAEGISLKNVRQVHIIEPHWNSNREHQVIGRAMRICSHADLPKSQRRVDVYNYYITSKQFKTTDVLVYGVANQKNTIIKKFLQLLVQSSFDCEFNGSDKNKSKGCLLKII